MNSTDPNAVDLTDIRSALQAPDARVLVVTGAAISRAAGLPTYRGAGGLYPSGTIPLRADDARGQNLPALWDRLADLIEGIRTATPTAAHRLLAEHLPTATVVTQNVDGLHEAAGSSHVLAMHGSLASTRCLAAGLKHRRAVPDEPDVLARLADGSLRCSLDGSRLRPDIVLFGEQLDPTAVRSATAAAREATVVLAVGTSLQVHPVAGLVTTALDNGAVGAWLDIDPAQALKKVAHYDYVSFMRLAPVPGDVQKTLPGLLDQVV